MTISNTTPNERNPFMAQLQPICGEPSLRPGEDREAYCSLRDGFAAAIKPRDALEAMWVQRLTDATWESWRREKLKTALLRIAVPRAVAALLRQSRGDDDGQDAADYVNGGARAKRRMEAKLAAKGYGVEDVNAKAYQLSSDEFSVLERLDAAAHARILSVAREIDRHRRAVAQQPVGPSPEASP